MGRGGMTGEERTCLRRLVDRRRRLQVGAVVDFAAMTHGTESTYTRGCRCDACVSASREARNRRGYASRAHRKTNGSGRTHLDGGRAAGATGGAL